MEILLEIVKNTIYVCICMENNNKQNGQKSEKFTFSNSFSYEVYLRVLRSFYIPSIEYLEKL